MRYLQVHFKARTIQLKSGYRRHVALCGQDADDVRATRRYDRVTCKRCLAKIARDLAPVEAP